MVLADNIRSIYYNRTNLLKNHPPRQSLWIQKSFQNAILGVKNSVKGRIEMHLRSFQTIQIWNDFSLDANSTLACSTRHLCFIRDSLSSLKLKIHRIAPNIKINKIDHALFLSWWLGHKFNIASIKILKETCTFYISMYTW